MAVTEDHIEFSLNSVLRVNTRELTLPAKDGDWAVQYAQSSRKYSIMDVIRNRDVEPTREVERWTPDNPAELEQATKMIRKMTAEVQKGLASVKDLKELGIVS